MRVRLSFGETTLPLSSITLEGLVAMARDVPTRLSSAQEKLDRQEILVFFTFRTGRNEIARALAEPLAGESEGFAKRWKQLQKGDPAPEPDSP